MLFYFFNLVGKRWWRVRVLLFKTMLISIRKNFLSLVYQILHLICFIEILVWKVFHHRSLNTRQYCIYYFALPSINFPMNIILRSVLYKPDRGFFTSMPYTMGQKYLSSSLKIWRIIRKEFRKLEDKIFWNMLLCLSE